MAKKKDKCKKSLKSKTKDKKKGTKAKKEYSKLR